VIKRVNHMSKTVYYSQEDARWRNVMYSIRNDKSQTIGTSGSGPTCVAMVLSSFTDKPILPTETAAWAISNGYRTVNSGTAWGYYGAIAKKYGLTCVQSGSLSDVRKALAAGHLVVASMGVGHFTGGGHYVLLTGIDGDWITVYDPNHDNTKYGKDGKIREGTKNDGIVDAHVTVFTAQAKQYWLFERPKNEDKGGDDTLELTKYQWDTLESNVKQLLSKGVISDGSWQEKVQKRSLTNSELNWLNNVVVLRLLK